MNRTELTKWQKRVKDRYLKNFDLDIENRKVYNYAVQQRATFNFDRILNNEIEFVDMQELYDMLPGLGLNQEIYDDLFERNIAIHKINYVLLGICQELWVFGDVITEGMQREILIAKKKNKRIRYFNQDLKEAS